MGIYRGDIIGYEKSVGLENFASRKPLQQNNVFAIGSVSKQFTAALLLSLANQRLLKLDDAVCHYLPDYCKSQRKGITIRQLLQHRSGLQDFAPQLAFAPGTNYSYSNAGYRDLGKTAEKAGGKSIDVLLGDLFKKADLRHTTLASTVAPQNFAGANLGTPAKPHAVEEMPQRLANDNISITAGGILSSQRDLWRWNKALYEGKIIPKDQLSLMTTPASATEHYILGKIGYGMGLMSGTEKPLAYFHTGYVKGSASLNVYYPASKTSIIILSNIANEKAGKKAVFAYHAAVKKLGDSLETAYQRRILQPTPADR